MCNSLTRLDYVCQKRWRVIACVIIRCAASNVINQGPSGTHHVTVRANEKTLPLISFTDHQDTDSPSFLLQGRDAAPVASLPHPALLCQMNALTHTLIQWPFCLFKMQSSCSMARNCDSDLCGRDVTLGVFVHYIIRFLVCLRSLPYFLIILGTG